MWKITMIILISLSVIACVGERKNATAYKMSKRFDLCIKLPGKSSYHLVKENIDYDIGIINIDENSVDVYIGQNPPFSGDVWTRSVSTTPGFMLVGKETMNGVQKILIGHKRYARRGPLFVMFSANDLALTEKYLVEEGFVSDCISREQGGAEKEKWQQP